MIKERGILMSAPMAVAIRDNLKTNTRRVLREPERMGCLTGDCPHEFQTECNYDLKEWIKESCPYGNPGDLLWVKETFTRLHEGLLMKLDPDPESSFWWTHYRADGDPAYWKDYGTKWTPSIFMQRKFSRFDLGITKVCVERVRDITNDDAVAEGLQPGLIGGTYKAIGCELDRDPIGAYQALWNSINLEPSPIYNEVSDNATKPIIGYECFPWSNEDFDLKYPGKRKSGLHRDKPLTVIENPWVWVIHFRKIKG